MKVLILGINYAPEPVGIGPYTTGLAETLAAAGHTVEAVVAEPYYPDWRRSIEPRAIGRRTVEQRVTVTRCRTYIPGTPTAFARTVHALSFTFSALPRAIGAALRSPPDIVFTVTPSLLSVAIAWIIARLFGARLWTHVQDFEADAACATGLIDPAGVPARMALWLERTLLRMSDKVSTISPQMQARLALLGLPPGRTYQLRNWAAGGFAPDPREANDYRTQWGIGPRKVVLYSGSIANKQGIEIIVDAARLLANRDDVLFVICGSGPNRQRLETLAAGLDNVRVHSLQPAHRMGGLLALAQVHVLPQIAEAADLVLPSKLSNMLSSGRPVVATAKRGTGLAAEVEGCGLITPPGDAAALAEAIVTLVDEPQLADRLGQNGIERARERWSQAEILAALETELRHLIRPVEPIAETLKQSELPSK